VTRTLLVTTSHSLLRVDAESGAYEPLHRGRGLYFGIATDGTRYFVAARGRMVSSADPAEDERGCILVFDRAMRPQGELAAPFPMRDLHEILWRDEKLWVTCSFDNMIAVLDESSGRWESWYPFGPTPQPPYDVNHLNSLAFDAGDLCVIAHNRGASELLRFDPSSRALRSRTPFGLQSHNIRRTREGALITCSSGDGTLVSLDGWRLEVGGFPRGIAIFDDETYVGISEIAERQDRDLSTGLVRVFDPRWQVLRTHEFPAEGLLLDIQELA
jgi:hypothetical protein